MKLYCPISSSESSNAPGVGPIFLETQASQLLISPVDGSTREQRELAYTIRRERLFEELSGGDTRMAAYAEAVLPSAIPYGVSMKQNLEAAKSMGPFEFKSAVQSGGPWDYKKSGTPGQYEDFGNFNYGFVARGLSWLPSESAAKAAAGVYQMFRGTSKFEFFNSYFDDPRDQHQNELGWGLSELVEQQDRYEPPSRLPAPSFDGDHFKGTP